MVRRCEVSFRVPDMYIRKMADVVLTAERLKLRGENMSIGALVNRWHRVFRAERDDETTYIPLLGACQEVAIVNRLYDR